MLLFLLSVVGMFQYFTFGYLTFGSCLRMIQKKIQMMAANHLKDDEWAQGTAHEAVKLPVKILGKV